MQVCWGRACTREDCLASLHVLQGLICCPLPSALKARESTSVSHIVVFSMAATYHHGCLYLQAVVKRQGQGCARVGRQGQQTSPSQLAARAARKTSLRRGDFIQEAKHLSRCCFFAWCRGFLHLPGVTFSDKA